MIDIAQIDPGKLDELSADQLRELTLALLARTDHDGREIVWRDAKIDKLTFEIAQLKRMKFDRSSEQLSAEHRACPRAHRRRAVLELPTLRCAARLGRAPGLPAPRPARATAP